MSESAVFVIGGLLVIVAAWVPLFLAGTFLSLPTIAVGIGLVLGGSGLAHDTLAAYRIVSQRVAEFALLVAVLGAGLRIDRRISFMGWQSAWRLLLLVMPMTIAAAAALACTLLDYPLGLAFLLAAVLSPTDPVLAASVQAGPPGVGEEGEPRFALTAEAGLNDGLALPFIALGLMIATGEAVGGAQLSRWLLADFLWNIGSGVAIGAAVGAALVLFNRRLPKGWRLADSNSGIVSVGLAFLAYGCATAIAANGFVAVFCEAVTIRHMVASFDYSRNLSHTAEQLERVAMVVILVFLGVSIANGLLGPIGWPQVAFVLLLLPVRMLAVALSFVGSPFDWRERLALGYFGIRGIASLYYTAALLSVLAPDAQRQLSAVAGLTVLVSVVLFGTTTDAVAKALLGRKPDESVGP